MLESLNNAQSILMVKCDISHFEFVFCKNMLYVTNINDIIYIIFVFDKNIILTIVFGSM